MNIKIPFKDFYQNCDQHPLGTALKLIFLYYIPYSWVKIWMGKPEGRKKRIKKVCIYGQLCGGGGGVDKPPGPKLIVIVARNWAI